MVAQQQRQAYQDAVSAERFAAAKTYEQYVGSIRNNREKFADNFAGTHVADGLARRLQALAARPDGPAQLLVLGEDWCPDVYRGVPVARRIADAAGLELRVLERDQNLDAAEPFKLGGEFLSIPVYVFYTKDHRYIAHWIERPKLANEQMREALSPIFGPSGTRQLTEKLGRPPTEQEKAAAIAERERNYDEFQRSSPFWAGWRDATVQEVTELLEAALGA
ncbi:MAG TPA: thioredoxin family protein [Dehalococcoidia bacterium]|nr:thioredoxin family protein [Dehalococcoidia bacterium]